MLYEVHSSSSPKRVKMYLQAQRIMGLSKDHGKTLHRSKRGWMWNQFFLLEEYTGPDTQYVGKVSIMMIKKAFGEHLYTCFRLFLLCSTEAMQVEYK